MGVKMQFHSHNLFKRKIISYKEEDDDNLGGQEEEEDFTVSFAN